MPVPDHEPFPADLLGVALGLCGVLLCYGGGCDMVMNGDPMKTTSAGAFLIGISLFLAGALLRWRAK